MKKSYITWPCYVQCISPRDVPNDIMIVGERYILDLKSIYIDNEGDAYADCYTLAGELMGRRLLKHFMTV